MTATTRYKETMTNIRQMLALLEAEADRAEEWRMGEETDYADVAELDRIVSKLVQAYGVLVADEDIRIAAALDRAQDAAHARDNPNERGVSRG